MDAHAPGGSGALRPITRRHALRLGGAAAAAAALGPFACSRTPPYEGPARHVIVVSLDTTRRDHLACFHPSFVRTPRLDALAAESIVFENHVTPVTTTLSAHTSMFTGTYPQSHGVPRNGFVLHADNVLLTEVLARVGFRTAAVLGSFALDSRFGFARGFDVYDEEFDVLVGSGIDQNQRIARSVTDTVASTLDSLDAPEHLFLFVHYFDPHAPYAPPPPFDRAYLDEAGRPSIDPATHPMPSFAALEPDAQQLAIRYAAEVSYMDTQVGRLLDALAAAGILEESILVLTADHGEILGSAPGSRPFDHGWTVYEPEVRVPLLVRLPGARRGGTRSRAPSSHVDLLPTLTGYLGLPTPEGVDGLPLDLETDTYDADRIRFSEATKPWKNVETDPRWINALKARSARRGRYKFIRTVYRGLEELYDVEADPEERENLLAGGDPEHLRIAGELKGALLAWTDAAEPLASRFDESQREETMERLRSLGYIQ